MKIDLFTNTSIFNYVYTKDENNREINIYKYDNVTCHGHNLYYPNVLLHNSDHLVLPVIEKTMSLKMSTIYEKQNMNFEITNTNSTMLKGHYFFFIYNTDNYFHYLYDTLPYLISYFKLKQDIPKLKLLMQYPNEQKSSFYQFIIEMLNIVNITMDDIIIINGNTMYENVYVSTSYTHDFDSNLPPRKEIYDFYGKMVDAVQSYNIKSPKKIYISRRTWIHNNLSNIGTNYTTRRKMLNEDNVVEQLVRDGYTEVFTENLSTIEKIYYFANATHVIGAIGGGIANVLFSKPETKLRAIISPGFMEINTRFKYSLDHVDIYYDYNTKHQFNGDFNLYMRVKKNDSNILGEIVDISNKNLTIQYTDGTNTGWNNNNKFKTMTLHQSQVTKLDNGLNSPYIYNYTKPTVYACHRINMVKDLQKIPTKYGIELDLRDDLNGNIYLTHDPYVNGELFDDFLKHYNHSFIILNIKSEGIESKIMSMLQEYNITDYFFLDSSFPMINKYCEQANFAIRFSEYESIETVLNMKNRVNWVWVDCFTQNPLMLDTYSILKQHFNLCFVSPELQGQGEKIKEYKNYFQQNNIQLDMICTKIHNVDKWRNVQIVIPMSGIGKRFVEAGYYDPKPLIVVDNKPIIEHVTNLFPGENNVTYICNDKHMKETNMKTILKSIKPNSKIYTVPVDNRQGPVHAVSLIFDHINDHDEVIISYCDYGTYWDYNGFLSDVRNNDSDGSIACYTGFHPHMLGKDNYAFVKEKDMFMEEIREKQPFTNNRMNEYASNGTYYFKSGYIMKKYFKQLIDSEQRINNEFYVSMVYNFMQKDNLKTRIFEIENMLQWGTPYDLEDYVFWSNYFKIKNDDRSYDNTLNTTLILPMAGHGSRFSKEGYKNPKPLIDVDGKTMIECAVDCLPRTNNKIFICLQEHIDKYNIDQLLKKRYKPNVIISLNHVTKGQACTCEIGVQGVVNGPILISACDNGVLYNNDQYNELINDETIDVIVWTYKNQSASKNNPNAYAWLETDDDNNVKSVSCKHFNPEKHDIKDSHVIIGTFFYRQSDNFNKGLQSLYDNNITTNNEYYVDDIINENIKMGLKVKAFQVSHYICWGTPNDYETYIYWQKYFDKIKN